jgi:hypothetical protein
MCAPDYGGDNASKAGFSPSAGLAATASVDSRTPKTRADAATLRANAVLFGIGPIVLLLLAVNGLDLSIGFF